MEMLLTPILLVGLVLYVAWPLLQENYSDQAVRREQSGYDQALEAKDSALEDLKDVEMDYRMGKLSQEDYERLRDELEARAVEALERVEALDTQRSA